MRKLFLFLIGMLLLSSFVSSLGVTPGRTTLDFSPGQPQTVEFTVINSEKEESQLIILVQGELNTSIALSAVSATMSATEEQKKFSYTFTAPATLSPGTHMSDIMVIKLPGKSVTSSAYVGAAVAVITQLQVRVPYPGKYVETAVSVIGSDSPGKVSFVVPVVSRGNLDIARVRAEIDIYGPLNEKIDKVKTKDIALASGARAELVAVWDTKVAPGTYRAVATVVYDEQTARAETQFTLGTRLLDLQQVEVKNFNLGDIAKFELLVENTWSEPIVGAYAQMQIFDKQGAVMADFKSPNYDVAPLSKALMVAFWDTAGVKPGTYDSSVFLRFGEQSAQQDVKLEVSQKKINVVGLGYVISSADEESSDGGGSNTLVIVLIIVIVVLVLINVMWFLVLRKKVGGKGK